MPGKARGPGKPFKPGDGRAGRRPGSLNKATIEVKEACREIVESPAYRRNLKLRAAKGELSPPVEVMLWAYAYGKPKEQIELSGPNGGPIRIGPMTAEEAAREIAAIEAEARGEKPAIDVEPIEPTKEPVP